MFCKWCGADIPNSAPRCKRCGKDVPALSNCGGFYDLVPEARRNPVNPSKAQQTAPTREAEAPETQGRSHSNREDPAKRKKNSGGKVMLLLMGVMLVCFVFMLVSFFVLSGRISDNAAEIQKLRSEIEPIPLRIDALEASVEDGKETEPTTPSEESEPTEPSSSVPETTEPDLKEQNISISFEVNGEDSECTVEPEELEDDFSYDPDIDGDVLNGISFDFGEDEECITVEIDRNTEYNNYYGSYKEMISVKFELEDEVFGSQYADAEYEWKWRYRGDSSWEELDDLEYYGEELFEESDDDSKLSCDMDELNALQEEEGDPIELQLVYERKNSDGSILTITIGGIAVAQENDQNDWN